jgi:hypothetical protein
MKLSMDRLVLSPEPSHRLRHHAVVPRMTESVPLVWLAESGSTQAL